MSMSGSVNVSASIMLVVSMPNQKQTMQSPTGGGAPKKHYANETEGMVSNQSIADTLELMASVLKEHVKFQNDSDADALALWIAMTYVMEHMEVAPLVYITSPEPMCGKSTVVKLLKVFCHNAEMVSKITPAAIYRLIERDQPTLLFDEADRFLSGNNELNGIINAGHARFEAKVIINKKLPDGNYEPVEFPVWCPKVIAGIGSQDGTLLSRSIVITLRRKFVTEVVKPVRFNLARQHEDTRNTLALWATQFKPVSEEEMEPILKASTDRGIENWLAIGIIAKRVQKGWLERIQAALEVIEARQGNDLQSLGVQLLSDVREVVSEDTRPEWASTILYNKVVKDEERDWSCFDHGRPITKKRFTQMLAAFGIHPVKRAKANVFYVIDLTDAFKRYLPIM